MDFFRQSWRRWKCRQLTKDCRCVYFIDTEVWFCTWLTGWEMLNLDWIWYGIKMKMPRIVSEVNFQLSAVDRREWTKGSSLNLVLGSSKCASVGTVTSKEKKIKRDFLSWSGKALILLTPHTYIYRPTDVCQLNKVKYEVLSRIIIVIVIANFYTTTFWKNSREASQPDNTQLQ